MPLFSQFIDGDHQSGESVRQQNVTAVVAIANIVKSSLGPEGLDKMLVDDVGDICITNDGATILKQLDIEHPAAKILVDLAALQDQEVGDGTTSVVIIAAEFLKRAMELMKQTIHATTVISGYRLASKEACRYIKEQLSIPIDVVGKDALIEAAKTSMSSKVIGPDANLFAKMCVDAILRVKTVNKRGKSRYPLGAVNVLKSHGKSMRDSIFVAGYALNCTVVDQAMPKTIKNAKIALLDFNLQRHKMKHGVKLVVSDPEELERMREREIDITKEKISMIIKAGANVVITTGGIDNICAKYFIESGIMAIRRVDKKDLRQIAKATGAQIVLSMFNAEGEDSFNPEDLGVAEEVAQEYVSDKELIYFRGTKNTRTSSIILRGPNDYTLDEMERSVHDVLCIVKRTLEGGKVVPGGGAVEAALSIYLENFATTLGSREQLAVAEFAEALLVIPKTLAVNAAKDATDLVAILRAHHNAAQRDVEKKKLAYSGMDLVNGKVRDNVAAGVIEPALSKIKAIQFATEAAITILRIDDRITLNPEPEKPDPHGH
mmetsp:Transcript_22428/g.38329  ORF Transcript_22428/g.38329 Transcript_22428/m.38329 type:complete len:547 (+) Transcript_22428:29-1669(+)